MKRSLIRILLAVMLLTVAIVSTGCEFGMKRDIVVINPDETAFAIPVTGDNSNQAQLYSERNLEDNKVSAKRYIVEYERVKKSGYELLGSWYPKVKLVVVSLKPVTRAWTGSADSGTASANQALVAETKESIRLAAEFNCNAAVDEANAAKFVHAYYGKQLEQIMDEQVRPYAQQLFTEQAAKYTMDEFLGKKSEITAYVRDGVTKKFATQGIRIMTLGMQGDIAWDPKIQDSIDARIRANNEMLANQARNKQKVEAAEAAHKEANLLGGATALKIRQLEIDKIKAETQRAAVEKWNGTLPTQMIPGGSLPFLNVR